MKKEKALSAENITPTLVNLYHVCQREMWLHAQGIRMEHTSDIVYEGKLIGETTYPQRPAKYTELDLGIGKIDFYDAENRIVHEVKKSDKKEEAHIAQVKYYLFLLDAQGIKNATGILEYPKLRKVHRVTLTDEDFENIPVLLKEIKNIMEGEICPPKLKKHFCRSCSYFEFCWVEE